MRIGPAAFSRGCCCHATYVPPIATRCASFFFNAAIEYARVRRPRAETPRPVAERKKESLAFVIIVEFVDLHRRLRHARQSRFIFLPDCARARHEHSCYLCRQGDPRMASDQRRRLKCAVGGRKQSFCNFRRRLPDRFFRNDQAQHASSGVASRRSIFPRVLGRRSERRDRTRSANVVSSSCSA